MCARMANPADLVDRALARVADRRLPTETRTAAARQALSVASDLGRERYETVCARLLEVARLPDESSATRCAITNAVATAQRQVLRSDNTCNVLLEAALRQAQEPAADARREGLTVISLLGATSAEKRARDALGRLLCDPKEEYLLRAEAAMALSTAAPADPKLARDILSLMRELDGQDTGHRTMFILRHTLSKLTDLPEDTPLEQWERKLAK